MADALVEGDVDGLVELSDLLKASGTSEKTTDFVLQLMFELTAKAQECSAAKAEDGCSNVINLFTGKRRE